MASSGFGKENVGPCFAVMPIGTVIDLFELEDANAARKVQIGIVGCGECVIVGNAQSASPVVSDLVAQAMNAARIVCNLHPGGNQIQGGNRAVGQALVQSRLCCSAGR